MSNQLQTNELASLIAGLPEVQALIGREAIAAREIAVQMRLDCMNKCKTLADVVLKAEKKQSQAIEALESMRITMEEKMQKLRESLCVANDEARSANRAWNNEIYALNKDHGEGHVEGARYLLNLHKEHLKNSLAGLGERKMMPGAWYSVPRADPGVLDRISTTEEELAICEEAGLKIEALAMSTELAPDEIKHQVEQILKPTGLWKPETATA